MSNDDPIHGLANTAAEWANSGAQDLKLDMDAAALYFAVISPVIAALKKGVTGLGQLPNVGTVHSAESVRQKIQDDMTLPGEGIVDTYADYAKYFLSLSVSVAAAVKRITEADGN